MSFAEIKKAINSDLSKPLNVLIEDSVNSNLGVPLDKMFGLTRLTSATVSTPATKEGYENFNKMLTISNTSGILIFYSSTYDTNYSSFPEKEEWIPVGSKSDGTAKYILILNKEMTYTFKLKSSRSGGANVGFSYSSNKLTYTIYQFGGGI